MNQDKIENLSALSSTHLELLGKPYHGKVRDCYTVGDKILMVATDRLSAFDRILTSIPGKGQVLTALSCFWFDKTKDLMPNHLIRKLDPQALLVQKAEVLPIEFVVRGYLVGSGYRSYVKTGQISGVNLPEGLNEFAKLPAPILTPSTKAASGHDEAISKEELIAQGTISENRFNEIESLVLELFRFASEYLYPRGIILADTKFEIGIKDEKLVLVDEIFTLDSSRYWTRESVEAGGPPKMLDKEPIRIMLKNKGFMGDGEVPPFTDDDIKSIAAHYLDSYKLITGQELDLNTEAPQERLKKNCASLATQ